MFEVSGLTLRLGPRTLFESINFSIPDGAKVGVVGPNGAGKTTLFRLLTGEMAADGGEIFARKNARIVQIRQELDGLERPLLDFVLAADGQLMALRRRAEHDAEGLADVYAAMEEIGGFSAEARAAALLTGLGFSQSELKIPVQNFSGGWQVRAALASTLFVPSDCLLLDEPTNHLDLETNLWLENFLKKTAKTLLLISHEKNLLNNICTQILHVADGDVRLYAGNYATFRKTVAELRLAREREREASEQRREHLQSYVDRFRARASKASQAQSRLKMLEKLKKIPPPPPDYAVKFFFPEPFPDVDRRLVTVAGATLGYGDKIVLRGVNFSVDCGDRIALLGVNGNGKSTLARAVAGQLAPLAGTVAAGRRVKIGYFSQQQSEELELSSTALQLFQKKTGQLNEKESRAQLARFGLGQGRAMTQVRDLSGGEKARLVLALILCDRPHLLILDEPTNHLDVEAREALCEAIGKFRGAVVLVTHDFATLRASTTQFYAIADGHCERFRGTLDDYRRLLLNVRGG
ncbi:MAG: ATP-binding cassette domain-containing protein [Puniceicoccales bacterium]|nr:ATP-binding cassette domain-containing protein [Puniceicoccales bacterium]